MIAPPTGTRIYAVASVTDMPKGFERLTAIIAYRLTRDPFSGRFPCSATGEATGSRCCGGTAGVCACMPSAIGAAGLCNRAYSTEPLASPKRRWRCS